MYVKYCENKPKSEYIVAEYIDFFEVITYRGIIEGYIRSSLTGERRLFFTYLRTSVSFVR